MKAIILSVALLTSCAQPSTDQYADYRWDGVEYNVTATDITLAQYLTPNTIVQIDATILQVRECVDYHSSLGKTVLEYSDKMPIGYKGLTFFESGYNYIRISFDSLWDKSTDTLAHELVHVMLSYKLGHPDAKHMTEYFTDCIGFAYN